MARRIGIINVVGARPNLVKIAPLIAEYKKHPETEALLVYTGQHYDDQMSALFFNDLGMSKPDVSFGVGSGSRAVQTAEVMTRSEPVTDSWPVGLFDGSIKT